MGMKEAAASGGSVGGMTRSGPKRVAAGHSAAITIQSVGLRRSAEQIPAAANWRQLVRTGAVWPEWSRCHHN